MAEAFRDAYALAIGVGGDLPVTAEDAKAVAAILGDADRCAIPADNIEVLTDWTATRAGIVEALMGLAGKAKADDVVTVYFSGHGGMLPAAPGHRFLVPRDRDLLDGEKFTELLRTIPAHRLLVLLDCCYAGGVHTDRSAKAPDIKSVPVPFDVDKLRLREGSGTVVLSSSRSDEVSLPGTPYSIFTQVLIEALCGAGAAQHDGYVRWADLAMYLAQWVPALTNDSQHPQLDLKEPADNYPVAYYAAGSKALREMPPWFSDVVPGPALGRAAAPSASAENAKSVTRAIKRLRDILVHLIYEEDEATQVVRDSGMTAVWTNNPIMFWQKALDHAHRSWQMEELFAAADEIIGRNPDWQEAKQNYLAAREADRRARVQSVHGKESASVDLTLNERRVRALGDALRRIVPGIFSDPRISAQRLGSANDALRAAAQIAGALHAAAMAERQQPRRSELGQLDLALRKNQEQVAQTLSELERVGSQTEASRPCAVLAEHAAALTAAYARAIHCVT